MDAVAVQNAVFQLQAEAVKECNVFVIVVFHELFQLGFDLLFDIDAITFSWRSLQHLAEMFSDRSWESTTPRTKRKCSGKRSAQYP